MKNILLFAATAIILVISCNKEDEVTGRPDYGKRSIFYASAEATSIPESKVYADENLMVLWNENDSISIFNMRTVNDLYVFTGEDGDTGGGFEEIPYSGFVSGNDLDYVYAVYPYSKLGNKINNTGTRITVTLPAEQTFKENSFGIRANTMVAVTDGNFLGFKNVCGYLKFRFYGDDIRVKNVTLEGNNGEKIAGKAYITPSSSSAPTVEMDNAATSSITLNCPSPVTIGSSSAEATDFIFVIPPTTFEGGFKVTVTDEMGATFEKSSTRSLTISRNRIESMGAMKVSPDYNNLFVEFEDANFKAYCVENFDTNNDGEISYTEAQEVTRINTYTNNPDITSLKGIEFFKNLTYLRCRGRGNYDSNIGKLTSLNISQNTLLDTVICINNQLTSLDLSNNTALTFMSCYYNQLMSLDMSKNTALISLSCDNNKLTNLDVSNNTALTSLGCNNNELTYLDLSNNTALTLLNCERNQLASLKLTNCTALTSLYCSNNKLSSLDVSGCEALKNLSCNSNQLTSLDVSTNMTLQELICDGNQLTSLDVSNKIALKMLKCSSNQLVSLNLTNCTALTNLNCSSNQLTSLDVSSNTALTSLPCDSNQLTSLDVSKNTALTYLSCYSNYLIYLDLRYNINLKTLYAWPQESTLYRLWKKTGQSISYMNNNYQSINPSDYGTEIIEVD